MIKKVSLIIMLCLSFINNSYAVDYFTDLNDAKVMAKQNSQDLLLIFSADYCKFCKSLKNEILSSNLTDNFVVCVIDIESNRILSRKFKARNLPTSVVVDDNLNEKSRIVGYNNEKYILWLEDNQK